MKTRILRLATGLVMVSILLLTSCAATAPATPSTPTAPTTPAAPVTPTTPVTPVTPAAPAVAEKPKYGGILSLITPTDIEVFAPAAVPRSIQLAGYVYEQFTNANWAKGPAGTGETDFGTSILKFQDIGGWLAESFETPEIGTWVLNIRKGVHFALDPSSEASRLANGREMTVEDIMWSFNYINKTPSSWIYVSQPSLAKNSTIEKTGPSQVTIRTPTDPATTYCWIMGGGGSQYIWAREVVEKYGKTNDWRQSVGTGPYMLTDFIPGSVATFTRNRNYWLKNPAGPGKGDQLPYPDGVKYFIVVDLSTRLATIRTGRADWITDIEWEDAESLIRSNPNLKHFKYLPSTWVIAMRTDKADLPFKDVRVRQALMLATDFKAMKNELYSGNAEIFTHPMALSKGTENIYIPLDQLPEAARSLYSYNPARAKQLLAEAGYPNGFKTKIVVQNTSQQMDSVAVFKDMWAKVGVDLEIQPRDGAVYRSINSARSHEEMLFRSANEFTGFSTRYHFPFYRGPSTNNPSYINDPPGKDQVIEAAYNDVLKKIYVDWEGADKAIRGVIPHIVEMAYTIPRPTPYSYRLWQPWLKNYYGESSDKHFLPYVWIDQDLKQQLIGRR